MDHGIVLNSQVRFKEKRRDTTVIRFGTVLSFTGENNEVAVVAVQDNPKNTRIMASTRKEIPVDQLESVKKLFGGRAVVHANPTYRTIGNLLNR